MKESVHFVFGTIYVIIGCGGLSCHGYLIWLLRGRWWLARRRLLLHLNFCVGNIGVVCMTVPRAISSYKTEWVLGTVICQLDGFLSLLSGFVSIWSLALLILDVVIRVHRPITYGRLPCWSYAVAMVIVWCVCFILALLPVLGLGRYAVDISNTGCGIDWAHPDRAYIIYLVLITITCFCLPYSIMLVGLLVVRWKNRKLEDVTSPTSTAVIFVRQEMKVYLRMVVVSLTAWTPYALMCYQFVVRDPLETSQEVAEIPSLMAKLITACVPFVYLMSSNTWQFHGNANTHSEDSTL